MMPAGPAWAVTLRPQSWAVVITASSSSGCSCGVSIPSCSPAIPPEIITLIRSAPSEISRRAPLRNSAGPSHSRVSPWPWPWPPVHTSARPAVKIRGPIARPASMARRRAKSAPSRSATQRTVVTPASSVRRAPSAMYSTSSWAVMRSRAAPSAPGKPSERWVWVLIRPGCDEGTGELDHLVHTVAPGVGEHAGGVADAGDPAVGDADRRAVERADRPSRR